MFGKNLPIKGTVKATILFFVIILICTFFSKTVYYFTLPKVSVEKPKAGSFAETTMLSQGKVQIKDAVGVKMDLPAALTIDEVFVAVGQTVSSGDQILRFDTEGIQKQIVLLKKQRENAEIALLEFMRGFNARIAVLREQIPNGTAGGVVDIKSPTGGLVTALQITRGDRVTAGTKLCEIADSSRLIVQIPFSSAYHIRTGMKAEVSVPAMMATLNGSVTEVGGSVTLDGVRGHMVTIQADNPGTIAAGYEASAVLEDGLTPMSGGVLAYSEVSSVYAEASGYISELYINQFESVAAGQKLFRMDLTNTDSAQDELNYMLTTGIYYGQTEKQLRDALNDIDTDMQLLEELSATGIITAEGDGFISSLPVSKNTVFVGGMLYEYAPEGANYQIVFRAGDMSGIQERQSCVVYCSINGRQEKMNGKITDVGLGYATVEAILLNNVAAQSQSFSAEVTISETPAAITVPSSAMAGSASVYVVTVKETVLGDQYIVSRREVTTGLTSDQAIEIVNGLSTYDSVIVAWDRALTEGAAVEIVAGQSP